MKRYSIRNKTILAETTMAVLTFVGGYALAVALTITNGASETGGGVYHATNNLAYWTESTVGINSQPSPVPSTLSSTVGTPTVLAGAATTYAINAPGAGNVVHFFKFSEATTAPINTELEIQFTVSTGAGPTITLVTVYVETQAAAIASAITFTLNYDLGSAGAGTITLNNVMQVSQVCSAVGTCP
jgi:hypothetical protein